MIEDENGFKMPELAEGYVSIIRANCRNCRIMNNDNTYYEENQPTPQDGGKLYYYIYRSLKEAENDIYSILENDVSHEYVISDNKGRYIREIKRTISEWCVGLINKSFINWGEAPLENNKNINLVYSRQRTFIRLFWTQTPYFQFVFTWSTISIYIDDNPKFEIQVKVEDVMQDETIFTNLVSDLFLSRIELIEFFKFKTIKMNMSNQSNKLVRQFKFRKSWLPIYMGQSSTHDYDASIIPAPIVANDITINPNSFLPIAPILHEGFFSVVRIRKTDLIVINNDNSNFEFDQKLPENNGNIYYRIYQSLNEAINEIYLMKTKDSSCEYLIYNNEGKEVERIIS